MGKLKLKIISVIIIFSMLIQVLMPIGFNLKTYAVTENDDIYDVILFWGQSNMVGSCLPRKESEVGFNPEDSKEVKNYSKISGISEDILNKNSKTVRNKVFIPQKSKAVYEYVYTEDNLKEITEKTTQFGEHLVYNQKTGKLDIPAKDGIDNRSLSASSGTNIIPEFCRTYYEKTGHKVVAVLAASEGKPICQFLPYNDKDNIVSDEKKELRLYESIKEKYKKAINYLNRNNYKIGNKMYVVFQGESDVGWNKQEDYYNQFMKVHNNLKRDLGIQRGALIETSMAGGTFSMDAVNIIHNAQEKLIKDNSDIILGSTFSYDKYVPIESDYNKCNTKITLDSNGKKISYQEALKKAHFVEDYINDEKRNNAIHLTSAALSQIGREAAQNLVNTIDKIVPQITKVIATDGNKTVTNTYSNNKLSGTNNIGNTWFKNNVTLKFEATDKNGIKSYWISGTKCQSKTISKTTNGVKLTVYDNANNETYVKVDIKIDKTGPTIKEIKQTVSSDKRSVNLTVLAEDSQSGISKYSFDGGNTWQKGNEKPYTSNQTINAKTIQVKDIAGNVTSYGQKIVINQIDTTKLKITNTSYTPQLTKYTNEDVVVKITLNKQVKINNNTWTVLKDGKTITKTYKSNTSKDGEKLVIQDANTGEKIETKIVIQNIDKSNPYLTGKITKSSTEKYVRSVTLTLPSIQDSGVSGLSIKPYSYDEGHTWTKINQHTYYENGKKSIWIRDNASNILKITEDIDNIDREKPVISSVKGIKTTWSKEDITLEVIASDNNGTSGLEYSFDNGTTWENTNKKTFHSTTKGIVIYVRDKAGWKASYANGKIIKLNIDKEIPTITTQSTKGITEWAVNGDYITMQIKDTGGSGIVESLWYREKGTNTWIKNKSKDGSYSHYYINKADSGKDIEFRVQDKAGNYSKILNISFKRVDFNIPKFTSVNVKGTDVIIKAEDKESGIKEFFDGTKWAAWPVGKEEVTIPFAENTTINAGTIKLRDNAGNIATYNKTIKIGIVTQFAAEINYSRESLTKTPVKVTVIPNKKLAEAPNGWTLVSNENKIEKTYNQNTVPQGENIKLKAEETGEELNVNVKITNIDTVSPTVNILGNPTTWVKEAVIEVVAQDENGIAGYSYNGNKYSLTNNCKVTGNGSLNIKVKDKAGNITEKTITINKIDDISPSIIKVSKPIYSTDKSKATVEIEAKDDQTGLYQYFDGKTWINWPNEQNKISLEFSENKVLKAGTIKIKDNAENETIYNKAIIIDKIDKEELRVEKVEYSTKELTNKNVIVQVEANKEILAPEGWTLVESDKKTITKTYTKNTEGEGENLVLIDANTLKTITLAERIKVENIDKTPPIVKEENIIYQNLENGHVKITVKANEEILPITNTKNGLGVKWDVDKNDNKIISTEVRYNKDGNILVRDKAGNSISVYIKVEILSLPRSLNPQITYKEIIGEEERNLDDEKFTKNNVKVIIETEREICEVESWKLSDDKKRLEKEYKNFVEDEIITLTDGVNNNYKEDVSISVKIDKTIPKITNITGNPTSWRKKAVIKVIAEDENGIGGYSFNGGEYANINTYTATENGQITIKVKDTVGNESEIQKINVTYIDNKAPIINSVEKNISSDKQTMQLVVNAIDEGGSKIKEYSFDSGITWQNENTYNYDTNQIIDAKTIKVRDNAGNYSEYNEEISITEIDDSLLKVRKTTYNPSDITNGNVKVTIETNKEIDPISGWKISDDKKSISKEFEKNTIASGEVIELTDSNTKKKISKNIIISNIDKTAPVVEKSNISYKQISNKKVQVTIKANERLQEIDNWKLLDDENTLVRTYNKNTKESGEKITIKDLAGNEKEVTIKIDTITEDVGFNIEVSYNPTVLTNKSVIVQIKADRNIKIEDKYKEKNWNILQDGKTVQKVFENNANESIVLIDAEDPNNKENVYISVDNIDKTEIKIIPDYEKLEDNKVKVTLISNKEIKELENWELSDSKLELSKIYEKDTEETIKVKDIFGEEHEVTIKVVIQESKNDEDDIKIYDINNNGRIDIIDLLLLKRHLVSGSKEEWKLKGKMMEAADANRDGKLNIIDLLMLKRELLKR